MYRCICVSRATEGMGGHHHVDGEVEPCPGADRCWRCRQPAFRMPPTPKHMTDDDRWSSDEVGEIQREARRRQRGD